MRKKSLLLLLLCLLFLGLSGCAVTKDWERASATNTIEGYKEFLNKHPYGSYSNMARHKIAEFEWIQVSSEDTISGYENFIAIYPWSSKSAIAKERLKLKYDMDSKELDKIHRERVYQLPDDDISRLVMAGANCLDENANWKNVEQGRKVYDILQRVPGNEVVQSLRRVVITTINRKQVLFLAVKLGIDGTQKTLNDLLMAHGDKSMAEDYLNCGSKELYDGAAAWGRARGYYIQTGPGSHRTSWGRF